MLICEVSPRELLQLHIRVAKRALQKDLRGVRPPRHSGQTWTAFLLNQAHDLWACDFLPVAASFFRPLYAFFVIE